MVLIRLKGDDNTGYAAGWGHLQTDKMQPQECAVAPFLTHQSLFSCNTVNVNNKQKKELKMI